MQCEGVCSVCVVVCVCGLCVCVCVCLCELQSVCSSMWCSVGVAHFFFLQLTHSWSLGIHYSLRSELHHQGLGKV